MTSNTIKGRDLSLHLAQHVETSEEIDEQDNALSSLFYIDNQILPMSKHPWYKNLVYYVKNQRCTDNLDTHQRRRLCLEYDRYVIIGDLLFRRSVDGMFPRCVKNEEAHKLLQETHGSSDFVIHVGHFYAKTVAFNIIIKGYYWPSIFHDFLFSKWGLDFIGPINPLSSAGQVFILTTMDYFTKRTEVVPLKHSQDEQVISFPESNIFSRFSLPLEIITDNGPAFISANLNHFLAKLWVKHFTSSSYYPQGNGQAKSTNENLVRIIKRLIEDKHRQWHTLLTYPLWEDRTTMKVSTGCTPLHIVYGQESILPTELELYSLRLIL
jgi:hypothetical protein